MKIVHVSTHDIYGGAARATYRLHQGLRRLGHESTMYVARRSSDDPAVVEYAPSMQPVARVGRFLRRERIARSMARYLTSKPNEFEIFTDDRTKYAAGPIAQLPACDVVNLHWIAEFIDYRSFLPGVPPHVPIVWRLADMNPFTGGCHFDNGCGRFEEACGSCPQLGSTRTADLSRHVWQRKRDAFGSLAPGRLHIVTLSRWMRDQVERSSLLSDVPVTLIPNGLDVNDFAPRDRCLSRGTLGVPANARVVLFVADSALKPRKGFSLLSEALRGLEWMDDLFLLSAGAGIPAFDGRIPHLDLGTVDYRWLSLVYSAADLFVIPSIQDNLPNTVMESMACGTPVVGCAVGGITDMVRHDITGLVVPPNDPDGLRRAMAALLVDAPRRVAMGDKCRRVAIEEYSLEIQARRYSDLYEHLVASSTRRRPQAAASGVATQP